MLSDESFQSCLHKADERFIGLLVARRLLHPRRPTGGDFDRVRLSETMRLTAQQSQVLSS